MYGASLGIFNTQVQRPWTTKFHLNRMNPAELWRHIDFSRWRPRRGNSSSDFVFGDFAQVGRSKSYLHTKFRWHFSIHCWDITTSGFLKQTSAILKFYFRFQFSSSYHHRHNTLRQPTKFYLKTFFIFSSWHNAYFVLRFTKILPLTNDKSRSWGFQMQKADDLDLWPVVLATVSIIPVSIINVWRVLSKFA